MNKTQSEKAKSYAEHWLVEGPHSACKDRESFIAEEAAHTCTVAHLMSTLAPGRGLDSEISRVIGYLHDIGRLCHGNETKAHAILGAELAKTFLSDVLGCSNAETNIITAAIEHHSSKKHIHGPYDELLKDADAFQRYLEGEPILEKPAWKKRVFKVLRELSTLSERLD
jgi:putative nucleotidyltransferase with HDIG domain